MVQFLSDSWSVSGKYQSGVKNAKEAVNSYFEEEKASSPTPHRHQVQKLLAIPEPRGFRGQGGVGRAAGLKPVQGGGDLRIPPPNPLRPHVIGEGGGVRCAVRTELGMQRTPKREKKRLLSLFLGHRHAHPSTPIPLHASRMHSGRHAQKLIFRAQPPPQLLTAGLTAQRDLAVRRGPQSTLSEA